MEPLNANDAAMPVLLDIEELAQIENSVGVLEQLTVSKWNGKKLSILQSQERVYNTH
jgi:hypothetical protein